MAPTGAATLLAHSSFVEDALRLLQQLPLAKPRAGREARGQLLEGLLRVLVNVTAHSGQQKPLSIAILRDGALLPTLPADRFRPTWGRLSES